jgi:hypothetical protein
MTMPGFSAESSLGKRSENYNPLGVSYKGADRSQVVPQLEKHCFCGGDYCWCLPAPWESTLPRRGGVAPLPS